MTTDPLPVRQILDTLYRDDIAQLPMRLAAIEQCWIDCNLAPAPRPALQELARLAHDLQGSARLYGLSALGDAAGVLEAGLAPWLEDDSLPDAEARQRLDRSVAALHELARHVPEPLPLPKSPAVEAPLPARVLLLHDDTFPALLLAGQLALFGYRVEAYTQAKAMLDEAARAHPAACILADDRPAGMETGAALFRLAPEVPLLYVSHRDDIAARLEAVRCGGRTYLRKPIDLIELVEELDRASGREEEAPYRILVVEDNASLARFYHALLRDAGMESLALTAPLQILQALDAFNPDAVLMDVYMPDCTGAELAQVIRQRKTHASLPIVFLSGEGDPDIQYAALRHGGNDFLTKPVNAEGLIRVLTLRARQSRQIAALMVTDAMTGLLNHGRITEMLHAEVARARRGNTRLSMAMIDLDQFRDINDRHGHQAGDAVIRSLVMLLRERLRGSDLAGRYGGESFLVVLPECDRESALRLIDDIRERFGKLRHSGRTPDQTFNASFSAGLAVFPLANSAENLLLSVEVALDMAKRQGRNRIH